MRFTSEQLKALSEITIAAGQVTFGATVVPFVFGIDKLDIMVLSSGLASTIILWFASIILVK